MIPELGHFALILALLVAVVQGVFPLWGTLNRNAAWQSLARPSALMQAALVALAFACLSSSFLSNDFSVVYVAQHSNTLLPKPYQLAAVWGGHEGSLLLWV
ncbi:MAG: c-type cytochrome biogenesis protein CcmF, partial [Betaproteobacteria bacterium]|nr:c-type cytochrome biogenesis protein CcmF [Betaproteobacteria bacterium]